ncbi:MAG: hypothetical protein GF334_12410 [Candidatus Altiarchaeales archaeon]|nr:hypothetical protein [Candidatus Altiarchaeales archaeon]
MPRKTSAKVGITLLTYVRACQFLSAQKVKVSYRECSSITGLSYGAVYHHLSKFTDCSYINVAEFVSYLDKSGVDTGVIPGTIDRFVDAIQKWREGRASVHAGCRAGKRAAANKLLSRGHTLQLQARHVLSPRKRRRPR